MKKILIAGLMIGASVAAHADSNSLAGVYAGADLVANRYDMNVAGATTNNGSGTNIGGKFLLGYNLMPNWAVEGGYVHFGSQTANYAVGSTTGEAKASGHTWYAAAKGIMPVNEQFSVFGKLGVANNHDEVSLTTAGASVSASNNQTDLYSAVGAQYNLSKNVGLTLELERYGKTRDNGMKNTAVSTGLRYSF